MALTEKNIFNYVFIKEHLTNEQIMEIEKDHNLKEIVDFWQELKDELEKDIPESLKIKIAGKIPAYSYEEIITLLPLRTTERSNEIRLTRYAAASGTGKTDSVLTFSNDNKNYFIRLHKIQDKFKVFVFSTLEKDIGSYELTFYPSKEIISIKENQNPCLISLAQIPDKIDMKLN